MDDFSYTEREDPNAPRTCPCEPENGSVRVCTNGVCEMPVRIPEDPARRGVLSDSVTIDENDGTFYAGDIELVPSVDGTFIIKADDIIIDGTVFADPSRTTTFGFLARRSLWVRRNASFRSTSPGVQVKFILHSKGKVFIDDGSMLSEESTCVCYRGDDGDESRDIEVVFTGPTCDQNTFQCYRIE